MKKTGVLILFLFLIAGCTAIKKRNSNKEYNFRFIGYTAEIDNPDNDKRCFYRLSIDKVRNERTTSGLDSQKKFFKTSLETGKHLLKIEKWILDERKKIYIKLNNIDQPSPNFVYFNVAEGKICEVEMITSGRNKTSFSISMTE